MALTSSVCPQTHSARLHACASQAGVSTGVVVESAVVRANVGNIRTNGVKRLVEAARWRKRKRKDEGEQTGHRTS